MRTAVLATLGIAITAVAFYLVVRSVDFAHTAEIVATVMPAPLAVTAVAVGAQVLLRTRGGV